MSNNNSSRADRLVSQAGQAGVLDAHTVQSVQTEDLGELIQEGLCPDIDGIKASEVVLVAMLIDDSHSIQFAGNVEAVRTSYNLVLNALRAAKQQDNILVHTRYLNGTVLTPFMPVEQVPAMDASNYDPCGGTPLYDQSMVFLTTLAAQVQEFQDTYGVPARGVALIVSDGADQHSSMRANDVARVVQGLLKSEDHTIAAMGIHDGWTDFRQVYQEMGIPDNWIVTPSNSEQELRHAFQLFSQSAVRVSQGGAGFSSSAGGFGG